MGRYLASAVAILLGEQFGAEPSGILEDPLGRVFGGLAVVLVFLAMFAQWAAALGQRPVDGATALGLAAGVAGMAFLIVVLFRLPPGVVVFLLSPIAVAVWHIWGWHSTRRRG